MAATRRIPARFDRSAWAEDLARSTDNGRAVATTARRDYQRHGGVPLGQLRPCDAEGRDGTRLGGCVKVYLPEPVGSFGMVFRGAGTPTGGLMLEFLAFGVRHHPIGSNSRTVYDLAHRRLHTE